MKKIILSLILLSFFSFNSFAQNTLLYETGKISVPMDTKGYFGIMSENFETKRGTFDGKLLLNCGGFYLSGKLQDSLWARGQAIAGLMPNYLPGKFGVAPNDSINKLYIVKKEDTPFGSSWENWENAVELGAKFYDGNNDGIYNPVDLNGNGQWDANEDKPDLVGDKMVWTIFNDGNEGPDSQYPIGSTPMGIEIKQTVFSFDSLDEYSDIIFIRYKIKNVREDETPMDSVFFSIYSDPDLGNYMDDFVGCDISLDAGYAYNNGTDSEYGNTPPCFMTKLISGPKAYIPGVSYVDANGNNQYEEGETVLDSAKFYNGENFGINSIPGACNLGMKSFFHYIKSYPLLADPHEVYQVRNIMTGYFPNGELVNPCDWTFGDVVNDDCNTINKKYFYSGDPVTNSGWLNNYAQDQRLVVTTGPFNLTSEDETEILVAYIVGQGSNALESITRARVLANYAQDITENNFMGKITLGKEDIAQIPNNITLAQNYPNPFNPSTTISFELPENSNVKLAIYNLLGEEVKVLVNSPLSAGTHKVELNGSNLASGMYLYRLTTDRNTISKKAILLK